MSFAFGKFRVALDVTKLKKEHIPYNHFKVYGAFLVDQIRNMGCKFKPVSQAVLITSLNNLNRS